MSRAASSVTIHADAICPRCGRRTVRRRDGIFAWRACPAVKACGWSVFTHGDDPRDGRAT